MRRTASGLPLATCLTLMLAAAGCSRVGLDEALQLPTPDTGVTGGGGGGTTPGGGGGGTTPGGGADAGVVDPVSPDAGVIPEPPEPDPESEPDPFTESGDQCYDGFDNDLSGASDCEDVGCAFACAGVCEQDINQLVFNSDALDQCWAQRCILGARQRIPTPDCGRECFQALGGEFSCGACVQNLLGIATRECAAVCVNDRECDRCVSNVTITLRGLCGL
jgi:hypothetical protein